MRSTHSLPYREKIRKRDACALGRSSQSFSEGVGATALPEEGKKEPVPNRNRKRVYGVSPKSCSGAGRRGGQAHRSEVEVTFEEGGGMRMGGKVI